jgi:uncharacterized protein YjbJ (UPF0337 family)
MAATEEHVMGDHKGERAKGRIKEAAGSLTDNNELRREGAKDQDKADVKKTWDKAKDAVNPDK